MSPVAKRLLNVAVIPAAVLAITCLATAVWGTRAELPFEEGVAVGNKELVSFRQGLDFRVGFVTPAPIFGLRTRVPTDAEVAAEEEAWGRPNHWLRLPSVDFSLWWPFALSVVVIGFWIASKRSRRARGFPVTAVRRAT